VNIESKAAHSRKAHKSGQAADYSRSNKKSGHAFSAANPYGKKDSGDKRQFVRS
jgi:ATP-dependent RNA helicase DDX18/HAS1